MKKSQVNHNDIREGLIESAYSLTMKALVSPILGPLTLDIWTEIRNKTIEELKGIISTLDKSHVVIEKDKAPKYIIEILDNPLNW